jgi:hypothetical protein
MYTNKVSKLNNLNNDLESKKNEGDEISIIEQEFQIGSEYPNPQ